MCGRTNNFGQTIQAIGNAIIPIEQRLEKAALGGGFNFSPATQGIDLGRHESTVGMK